MKATLKKEAALSLSVKLSTTCPEGANISGNVCILQVSFGLKYWNKIVTGHKCAEWSKDILN